MKETIVEYMVAVVLVTAVSPAICYVFQYPNDENTCSLPKLVGPCFMDLERYYFNPDTKECELFHYGGCEGNANNFFSKLECYSECVCKLSKDAGPCKAIKPRFYFDAETMMCTHFDYGGCRGNSNNFGSLSECQSKCPMINSVCSEPALDFYKSSCEEYSLRWRYNLSARQCQPFIYTGCDGNGNNFLSRKQCILNCPRKQPCVEQKDPGPCEGKHNRWYYDSLLSKCIQFTYGGCGGNENNFIFESECRIMCENLL